MIGNVRPLFMLHNFHDQHLESQRILGWFHNHRLLPRNSTLLCDLKLSHGPFLRLADGRDVFDARTCAPKIGYNASPLFGALHILENWLGFDATGEEEHQALQDSFAELYHRFNIEPSSEPQSAAARHRDYISAFICQQYSDQTQLLAKDLARHVSTLMQSHSASIVECQFEGLAFSLRPVDRSQRARLLESRLEYNLLFDVGRQDFRFTLNLGFRPNHLEPFWRHLRAWLTGSPLKSLPAEDSPKVLANYRFHQELIEQKAAEMSLVETNHDRSAKDYLRHEIERTLPKTEFQIEVLTPGNYPAFRQQILEMQAKVYEPARQTSAEEFDTLFDIEKLRFRQGENVLERPPLAIVVLVDEAIVSMAFAGPLDMFPDTRGATTDPHSGSPTTYYMLDLTVVEEYRGKLGRLMKNALTLLASQTAAYAIHGRNRDRLARGMWAINLSLGSYELQHLPNDYDDDHAYRDCIYYRCPIRWTPYRGNPFWSRGLESPTDGIDLQEEFFTSNMPIMVNGQHRTETCTFKFIKELEFFAGQWPKDLRHVHTTCHPESAIMALWKALASWRESHQSQFIVALEDSDVGNFDGCKVVRVPNPCESGKAQFLESLAEALSRESQVCSGVFVEPIVSTTCDQLPVDLLLQTKKLCRDANAPFVLIESASLGFRYNQEFAAGCTEGLLPDAVIAHLGNSMTVVLGRIKTQPRDFFHGGEPMGLFGFNELVRHISANRESYQDTLDQFDQRIMRIAHDAKRIHVERGVGWIEGHVAPNLEPHLSKNDQGRYLVCPTLGQMMAINKKATG